MRAPAISFSGSRYSVYWILSIFSISPIKPLFRCNYGCTACCRISSPGLQVIAIAPVEMSKEKVASITALGSRSRTVNLHD